MTRTVSIILFTLGAGVVLWMSSSFVASSTLALLVSVLIAAAYTTGFVELLRYQRETTALQHALDTAEHPVTDLNQWLQQLPTTLRFSVRQRIYGEATGLPAPLLTPYLVGLLVMLGLLGTFIGMVETLQGAVGALQGSTELEAVRDGLAAPIQGLGLAFATSVAGITASAMLGLISTLSRRERLQASRTLDSEMADAFKVHSLNHQRRETYDALRAQSTALPAVAEQLGSLAKHFDERMQQLADNLTQSQQTLQSSLATQFEELSQAVETSLSQGFKDTGRVAAESAAPVLQSFMDSLRSESHATEQALGKAVDNHLNVIQQQLASNSETIEQSWQRAMQTQQNTNKELLLALAEQVTSAQNTLSNGAEALLANLQQTNARWLSNVQEHEQQRLEQWQNRLAESAQQLHSASETLAQKTQQAASDSQRSIASLVEKSDALLQQQTQREADWQSTAAQQLDALVSRTSEQLIALRNEEQQRGEAAIARLAELQESSASQLASLGAALEEPMSRLMATASDAPKAAAEVIAQLRSEISKNIERDNTLLEERQQTLGQMEKLSASLEENARLQREAVEAMLQGSTENLASVAQKFEEKVTHESAALNEQIASFSASTAELTALGEVFTNAVQQFGESNSQLMTRLEQIESVLVNAGQRSDEQMAYYLSQAREIIDHNLLTQQELLERLQKLGATAES
ncbi:hypothetical protein [Litorivivens sp.]|uniref:hypothetical protein n=1 Tax=Litorivivens sp. TaxID=2020868 RepID=UPI0035666A54